MFAGRAALGVRIIAGVNRQLLSAAIICLSTTSLAAQTTTPGPSGLGLVVETILGKLNRIGAVFLERALSNPLASAVISIAVTFFILSLMLAFRLARARKRNLRLKGKSAELEIRLDEAEILLSAEPHLLVIWQGKEASPTRIANGLQDIPGVPVKAEDQYQFHTWLTESSAAKLQSQIEALRNQGTPFNVILYSKSNAVIEACGRATGRLATLSMRQLTGEHLNLAQVIEDSKALHDKVESLTAILNSAPIFVWLKDARGKITWVNDAYIAALDVNDREEIIERQIDLVTPDNSSAESGGLAHVMIAGARHALSVMSLEVQNSTVGMALDVTELAQAKEQLDQHITAHTRTLDHLMTAVAIFGPDQKLRFFNAAYVTLWQLDETWLKEGPSDSEVLDALREARRLPEQADFRKWKTERLTAYTKAHPQEDWYLPDGQTIRVVAQQHPFGGLTYLYENVTERLALESSYNALSNVQTETLDNLHEGVGLFGSDGRLKLYNPAYETIWQLHDRPLKDKPHIDDVISWCRALLPDDEVWVDLKQAVTPLPGDRPAQSGRMTRPDNKVIDFASVPLPDGATLLTYVDVTASANAEHMLRERADALETADRLKTEFISHISRELRTPLTNILGFTDSLALGIAGELNGKQSEYVGYILKSSNALLAIIDDILDLATIDAGVMDLDLAEIEISELVTSTLSLVQDRITEAGLTLQTDIDASADSFRADKRRVKQILYNLLSNAIGFSRPGGSITLRCYVADNDVCFTIADTGRGIEPEQQLTVFDRFEATPSGNHRGAGLGLSIVKSFVELHGGTVSLDSTPGKGTSVTCTFPKQLTISNTPSSQIISA